MRHRLTQAVAACVLMLGTGVGVADATVDQAPPGDKGLEAAVTDAMEIRHAERARVAYETGSEAQLDLLVERKRRSEDGRWAFGGAVYLLPEGAHASPVTSLFLAHRRGDGWDVALKGTAEFTEAAGAAPDEIFVDAGERAVLAGTTVAAAPALGLPWLKGQGGWRHYGVHGNSGTSRPYNSIDFYGGDGQVRASAPGYLYRYCGTSTPLIEIEHAGGWTTGYYHTWAQTTVPDGSLVQEGAHLGRIGTQLPCGGRASGDHVHWTLWQNGSPVAVHGRTIGGWTWYEQPAAYSGWAQRGTTRVYVMWCCLTNEGSGSSTPPQPTATAYNPGGWVNVRSGPSTSNPVVGTLAHGTVVTLQCYVTGQQMTGPWNNTSTAWDRLPSGGYVADAWLDTGSPNPIVPPC
jgi:LasA protease